MIVFDLKCAQSGHIFEGWFGSSDDFEQQKATGLLVCPMCGDTHIEKAVMAPAVAAKSNQRVETPAPIAKEGAELPVQDNRTVSMQTGMDKERAMQLIQTLATAQAEALANSEWVGGKFAEEARAIHYGEEEARPIHGEVDKAEARSLIEEGIEVAPLLFPIVPAKAQN